MFDKKKPQIDEVNQEPEPLDIPEKKFHSVLNSTILGGTLTGHDLIDLAKMVLRELENDIRMHEKEEMQYPVGFFYESRDLLFKIMEELRRSFEFKVPSMKL